jgi:hypothetical protein
VAGSEYFFFFDKEYKDKEYNCPIIGFQGFALIPNTFGGTAV